MKLCFNNIIYRSILIYLKIYVVFSTEVSVKNDPIVTVNEGKLKGSVGTLVDGSEYFSFKGIPYASPPVGVLRFKAPLPPKPWEGFRDATDFGSVCTQYNLIFQGDEDCLFLNVYTNSLNSSAKIPVMVYIHGGSYLEGSGNTFLPDFLLPHGVILVTLNYRLDLLGFLSLDIPEVPGNAAMKDQVAALKWVQKNIINFGGDSNNVTIFGQSAGASSVTYHMLSPMAKGLFHKAIAQSGVAITDWALCKNSRERAFRAGKSLGKETGDVQELLDYFRSLDAKALTNLTLATLTPDERYREVQMKFVPVTEKIFPGVEAFITEEPLKILVETTEDIELVPLMLGYNSGEGLILLKNVILNLDVYNEEPSYFVPREVAERVSKLKLAEFGERIKEFYVGNRNITEKDGGIIANILTDIHFAFNIHRFAHLYTYHGHDTFMYRFNYDTDLNIMKRNLDLKELSGVCHGDELLYLFYNHLNEISYKNQKHLRDIIYNVTKMWTDFAKTGKPTLDDSSGVSWQCYTKELREYLNIGEPTTMGQYADKDRVEFWSEIYLEAGVQNLQNVVRPYEN